MIFQIWLVDAELVLKGDLGDGGDAIARECGCQARRAEWLIITKNRAEVRGAHGAKSGQDSMVLSGDTSCESALMIVVVNVSWEIAARSIKHHRKWSFERHPGKIRVSLVDSSADDINNDFSSELQDNVVESKA